MIITIITSAIISNTYIIYSNKKYENIYVKAQEESTFYGIIVDNGAKKEYVTAYSLKIKNEGYENKKIILYIRNDSGALLEYGDYISIKGEYLKPEEEKNYKGFNYKENLKTKNTIGGIKVDDSNVKIIEKNKIDLINLWCNRIRQKIIENSKLILSDETSGVLQGLLIGEKTYIQENIEEDFKDSNLSHVLATSGMHINYIILGLMYLLNKIKIPKKVVYSFIIIILLLFMVITNFTPSVIRAVIMATMLIISKIVFRKYDVINSISISLLITLIYNPFSINSIGLQLSYMGTIGIIAIYEEVKNLIKRGIKFKIPKGVIISMSISIAAQLLIFPILAIRFNTISLSFFISTLIAIPLVEVSVIYGFSNIIISFFSIKIARIFSIVLNVILKILIFFSEIISQIKILNLTVITPSIVLIISYYTYIFLLNYIFKLKEKNNRKIQKTIVKRIKIKEISILLTIVCVITLNIQKIGPKDFTIHFIDVGQGDSTLVITNSNKKILIDGGDNKNNILVPYLLNRNVSKIDYILISHFDTDHCNGLIEVLERIKVKSVILPKQNNNTEEYENIKNIIKKKKIKLIFANEVKKICIDKHTQISILNPIDIKDDSNDNSIVAQIKYNNFSILFTGDINKTIESELIEKYGNNLKSDILKIAHHGSKTSSSEKFIKEVNPQIALIGVGKNNMFGHPNIETLECLNKMSVSIYRTDLNGEITIKISKTLKIRTMY